ncbi:peptidoglycan-binding protein [Polaromonas sp. SM01]|uniref:peptidoglycan-binding protein n=1 Tax=Polaromonas sp. SM01 TaxID=3085630 RepID=UPI0029813488|nr:peptidoglycan-binding protein [Polaromonas sp. SM01]MDW5444852.1 peptidoglycan-binding protein [Polaromonas sp. SM01]
MARPYFSRGCKGMIAKRIQTDLQRQGFVAGDPLKFVDGDFGGNTRTALQALQTTRALPVTGAVDGATWQQLTPDPLPSLFERCLQVTAAFEGHGFGLAQGNFDGAGITWDVIGFTQSNREIQAILTAAEQQSPGTLVRVMGPLAAQWQVITAQPLAQQIAWADAMSSGPGKQNLPAPWVQAFARLGDEAAIKRIQMQRAYDRYFVPCATSAATLKLHSELGVLLAFDVHVQNGGFKPDALALAAALPAGTPEGVRRAQLAEAVANSARPQYRADVLSRKKTMAMGQGVVHGGAYTLAAWGLGEEAAA